jgi:hypothetical protein
VIREAMRSKALVALGRVVLSKRERVMALEPYDKGLIGTTLHYPYEVRGAKDWSPRPRSGAPGAPRYNRLKEQGRRANRQGHLPHKREVHACPIRPRQAG